MKLKFSLSLLTLSLLTLLTVGAALINPRWERGGGGQILTYDVFGYYTYLPGACIYGDLGKLAWVDTIVKKYNPPGGHVNYVEAPKTGNRIIKYSSGLALMYSPFFLAAHTLAGPLGFEKDGFSKPYQLAIAIGGLFFGCLGAWFSRKILLRHFTERTTAATLFFLMLGTNWHHYARFDYGHSHIWLFCILAALIWQTILFWEKVGPNQSVIRNPQSSIGNASAIGLLLGLLVLTRPTEAIAVVIPLLWGMNFSKNGLRERFSVFKNEWKSLLLAAIVAAAVGFIQLIYWKLAAGQWLFYSYDDQTFSFLRPHLIDGLFSFKKGWLLYTPLMIFGLTGLFFLKKHRPGLFWSCLIFTVLNIYIAFSWDIWWYGGSFGQRPMVQGYAVLMIPLAGFIEFGLRKTWAKNVWLPLMCFFVLLNIFQSWQGEITGLGLDAEGNTRPFYRRMFLRFKPDLNDLKLLDGRDDFGNLPRDGVKTIFETDFEQDTSPVFIATEYKLGGAKSLTINGNQEFVNLHSFKIDPSEARWVRITGQFFTPQKAAESWLGPALVLIAADLDGKPLRDAYHKPMRYLDEWRWKELFFDLKIPQHRPVDHIDLYFWQPNKNSRPLFVDNIRVETFK